MDRVSHCIMQSATICELKRREEDNWNDRQEEIGINLEERKR